MPVGTQATVKGVSPDHLRDTDSRLILANTYHLLLRPGPELIAEFGGLHEFMGWDGPILTDSGGFQIFSLATLARIDDHGVTFRSHIDGAALQLDPRSAIEAQNRLGADIIMALDQCPPYPCHAEVLSTAIRRTLSWAEQCLDCHRRTDQALFGIVQGGLDRTLRCRCAAALRDLNFAGYAIGGLSVGETPEQMIEVLDYLPAELPADAPRYLMGVGMPRDIVAAVRRGVDMFDCVLPTRNGRNAYAFTAGGPLKLRNARHRRSAEPLEVGCDCYTCTHFSRGYIRHLFGVDEMLGPILASIHNIRFYQRLMTRLRALIDAGEFERIYDEFPVVGDRPL